MAFTQQNLDAIEKAIASGTLTVEYNGKRITYQSTADLIRVRNMIKSDLENRSGTGASRSSIGIYRPY
ncbi:phage head-tail joining protein [Burkholderia sp. Bp9142]|uniref:phage head-tail joining protein n=1 Tax=Burkholderia sp. Bp9142 TaxID=2184573 RepID=UPI000F5944AD|nr:hypothetical protein [Burkholderia sp. Bp9142]RQR37845.1 hypothetical protein DIE22_10140 [Burkholderia sp. Bp9142]